MMQRRRDGKTATVRMQTGGGMSRRSFGRMILGASALGLVDAQHFVRVLADSKRSLGWLAAQTASGEGLWSLDRIEGGVPRDLNGTLYRTCPGQRENHGVTLRHLFDGDAYVSGYSFRDGKVQLRGRFVETPQRKEELEAGRMLYSEFGTPAPPPPEGWKPKRGKNQPSVNIIPWDGRLLGLSEGGHPAAIDPRDLSFQGYWDFKGTLPAEVPFTAHPRFDPATGVGYGYGVRGGRESSLMVYRMERDGTLAQLYDHPLDGYYIIHDMLLTQNHIVFVVPPARIDFSLFFTSKAKVAADAVRYYESAPLRFIVMRRDGKGTPTVVEQPASVVFHHGNAFEENGRILLDTVMTRDGSALEAVYSFGKDEVPVSSPSRLTRFAIDPAKGTVESRTDVDERNVEFPRYDLRRTGSPARYLYAVDFSDRTDTFAGTGIVRFDLKTGAVRTANAGARRVFSEPVFVPNPSSRSEERGWLLVQGYDADRDTNFLEVRDAETLDFAARIWAPVHFPLGFHGNFSPATFVA